MKNLTAQLKEQLPSFEAACKIEGLESDKVIPDFAFFPERDREAMQKLSELVIIIKAANRIANDGKEWIPEYGSNTEAKWEPWFELDGLGGSSGFRFGGCGRWASGSRVGSRLCFFNSEVGDYVVTTFLAHYEKFFVTK